MDDEYMIKYMIQGVCIYEEAVRAVKWSKRGMRTFWTMKQFKI